MSLNIEFVMSADAANSLANALEDTFDNHDVVHMVTTWGPVINGRAKECAGKIAVLWNEDDETVDMTFFAGRLGSEKMLYAREFVSVPVQTIHHLKTLAKSAYEGEVCWMVYDRGSDYPELRVAIASRASMEESEII